MISGTILMGTAILGIFGLPLFLRGLFSSARPKHGLSVRPIIVTLIGYMVILDAALNTFGWAIDLFASHTYVSRISCHLGQHLRCRLLLALQRARGRRGRRAG